MLSSQRWGFSVEWLLSLPCNPKSHAIRAHSVSDLASMPIFKVWRQQSHFKCPEISWVWEQEISAWRTAQITLRTQIASRTRSEFKSWLLLAYESTRTIVGALPDKKVFAMFKSIDVNQGWTHVHLERLAFGVAAPLKQVISESQQNPLQGEIQDWLWHLDIT